MKISRKFFGVPASLVVLVLIFGLALSGCKKDEEAATESEDTTEGQDEEDDSTQEEDEDEDSDTTSTANFSQETQKIGEEGDKREYDLVSIDDTSMSGYVRLTFELDSEKDDLPEIEARLVESGGYIKVTLNQIDDDNSGIALQAARDVSKYGIKSIYHEVSGTDGVAIYKIGYSGTPSFYLHKGSGLKALLDVKATTVDGEEEATDDPENFTDGNQELSNTNTAGDVRINSYSWAVEGGVLKFSWETSSVSGNPIPPTTAGPGGGSGELVVHFEELERDSVLGSDDQFETVLSGCVQKVIGTKTAAGGSEYVFLLTKDTTWKLSRSTSPNKVVLEIKL